MLTLKILITFNEEVFLLPKEILKVNTRGCFQFSVFAVINCTTNGSFTFIQHENITVSLSASF
jgi:hypothetical protein